MSAPYRTLVEAMLSYEEEIPDKPAVSFGSDRLTYGDVARQMKAAAVLLEQEYGIKRGDKVLLSAVSRPDYIVCFLESERYFSLYGIFLEE